MTFEEIFNDWPDELKYCTTKGSEYFNKDISAALQSINVVYNLEPNKYTPAKENIFRAFKLTSFDKVKVVLLGQDPYPSEYKGRRVAVGLAFGVEPDIPTPKSLQNILKALPEDLFRTSELTTWADQGVLLLNTALTMTLRGTPKAHLKVWKPFTELVFDVLNKHKKGLVFALWGGEAQKYKKYIDMDKHHVVEDIHPAAPCYNPKLTFTGKFNEINSFLNHKIVF